MRLTAARSLVGSKLRMNWKKIGEDGVQPEIVRFESIHKTADSSLFCIECFYACGFS